MALDGSVPTNEVEVEQVEGEDLRLSHIRSLEKWYAAELEHRLNELYEKLNSELQAEVASLRQSYQEQYKTLEQRYQQQPQEAAANPRDAKVLGGEIKRAEAEASARASELERMVADDTIPLGKVLQARTKEFELKAYIQGLKFGSASSDESKAS